MTSLSYRFYRPEILKRSNKYHSLWQMAEKVTLHIINVNYWYLFAIFISHLLSNYTEGSSCRDILFSKQQNCNFVYLSRYSWKLFHFHILRAPYTYIHIYTLSEFNNLLFVIDMRNMTDSHPNAVVFFFLPSLLKQHDFMCA